MTRFGAHGELSARRDGRIMILEGAGPWNMEALNRSADTTAAVRDALWGQPWGVIAIVHGEAIHVPDAADLLVSFISEDLLHGRVGSGLIVKDSDSPTFAANHIADIYQRAGEMFEFFDDLPSARTWVQNRIDHAMKRN